MIPQLNPRDQNILKSAVDSGPGAPVLARFHLSLKRNPKNPAEITAAEISYNGYDKSRVTFICDLKNKKRETEVTPRPENRIRRDLRTNQTKQTRPMTKKEVTLTKIVIASNMINSPQLAQLSSIIKAIDKIGA